MTSGAPDVFPHVDCRTINPRQWVAAVALLAAHALPAETGEADGVPESIWGRYPPSAPAPGQPEPEWLGIPLRTGDQSRATRADILGPDGIYYPNWSRAGNPAAHEAPRERRFDIREFGAVANDGKDDAAGLQQAIDAAADAGGGTVILPAGVYYLDQPVFVAADHIVIKGEGVDATRLICRYEGPEEGPRFIFPSAGESVGANSWIEVHAKPQGLQRLELHANGRLVHGLDVSPDASWRQSFALRSRGEIILEQVEPGSVTLQVEAWYDDGRVALAEQSATLHAESSGPTRMPQTVGIGAITFIGGRAWGAKVALLHDGKRGDDWLVLDSAKHGLKPGSAIELVAPNTERWFAGIRNQGPQRPDYRRYQFEVVEVEGNRIVVDQPLRIDFPTADGAYIWAMQPLRNSRIESLELEMRSSLASLNGIAFLNVWACSAGNIRVLNAGRHQLIFASAKWCRVRDSFFRDRRSKGGGTDYIGFTNAYDCLMERVVAMDMRHAPVVQWSASGNVIRDCLFYGSDGQWHAGWANENLFENCIIVSRPETGSYGYGLWASPPEDPGHGPNGPRNVVYGCDIFSPKTGIWLGGMNERWLFLHNRITVSRGAGVALRGPARGHLFKDNVFVLHDAASAAVALGSEDVREVEFIDNTFFGVSRSHLFLEPHLPGIRRNNEVRPEIDDRAASRPQPLVPSIFEWQQRAATPAQEARREQARWKATEAP